MAIARELQRPGPAAVEKFWSKAVKGRAGECWEWQGTRDRSGYGTSYLPKPEGSHVRRKVQAHRLAYAIEHGVCPAGPLVLRHICNNPSCVNPAHLELGTNDQNSQDCVMAGRSMTGSKNHKAKLTEAQVVQIRERYAGGETQKALAKELGVSRFCISHICTGRFWTHVGGPVAKPKHTWTPVTQESRDRILRLWDEGYGKTQIRAITGHCHSLVADVLKMAGKSTVQTPGRSCLVAGP